MPHSQTLGHHYVWDLSNCSYESISLIKPIEALMYEIIDQSGLTLLKSAFNQFSPHGVTGVFLLEESHLSAHSWPENRYLALDLFSCIELKDHLFLELILKKHLGTQIKISFKKIERVAQSMATKNVT